MVSGVGIGVAGIIATLESIAVIAGDYARTTITILITLQVVVIGYMIAMGRVSNGADLIWKVFTMAVMFWVASNLRWLSDTLLECFLNLIERLVPGSNSPAEIFKYPSEALATIVGKNFEILWEYAMTQESSIFNIPELIRSLVVTAVAFFMVFIILFAIINYYLAYMHYLIALIWGTFLYPFTLFKPLSFIGESIIKGLVGLIIKQGMIFFVLLLGITLLKSGAGITAEKLRESGVMLFLVEKVVTCLVVLYLTTAASHIANEIMTGSPSSSGITFGGAVRAAAVGGTVAAGAAAWTKGKAGAVLGAGGRTIAATVGGIAAGKEAGHKSLKELSKDAAKAGLRHMGLGLARRVGEATGFLAKSGHKQSFLESFASSQQAAKDRRWKKAQKIAEQGYVSSRNLR